MMDETDIWVWNGKYIVDMENEIVIECKIFGDDGKNLDVGETVAEGMATIFDATGTNIVEIQPQLVRDEERKEKIIESVGDLQ